MPSWIEERTCSDAAVNEEKLPRTPPLHEPVNMTDLQTHPLVCVIKSCCCRRLEKEIRHHTVYRIAEINKKWCLQQALDSLTVNLFRGLIRIFAEPLFYLKATWDLLSLLQGRADKVSKWRNVLKSLLQLIFFNIFGTLKLKMHYFDLNTGSKYNAVAPSDEPTENYLQLLSSPQLY